MAQRPPVNERAEDWEETPTVLLALRQLRQSQEDTHAILTRTVSETSVLRDQIVRLADDVQQLTDAVTRLNQILLQRGEWLLRLIEHFFGVIEIAARRAGWKTILATAVLVLVVACWSTGELSPLLAQVGRAIGVWSAHAP